MIELDERQICIEAVARTNEGAGQPLRDFLAWALSRSLDFALAVAAGQADPSWQNEHGDPHRSPEMPRSHMGETPPPHFDRAQDTTPPGSMAGEHRNTVATEG